MTEPSGENVGERWQDFATRMASAAWPNATENRQSIIANNTREFIETIRAAAPCITDWDGSDGGVCVGDELMDFLDARGYYHEDPDKHHRLANQISCCVRAGLDVASRPSAGVVGFDVSMLKRMWDGEEIPAWVREWFDPPIRPDTPDNERVWL